jgi:hypothetical protein
MVQMASIGDQIVEMVNEHAYSFGSSDNVRHYATEILLDDDRYRPTSVHGIVVNSVPVIVVGAGGGASGVHAHSMLRLGEILYFAVGPNVCRFTLGNKTLDWSLQADDATCFGIYYSKRHNALISHGELQISRFSDEGQLLWSAGGADIFSEGISLSDDCIEAIDFEHRVYHFDYTTGRERS